MQVDIITFENHGFTYDSFPSQAEIDAAYAVRIFLKHHPGHVLSLHSLIRESGIAEQRLKAAFQYQFHERLEEYWEKMHVG